MTDFSYKETRMPNGLQVLTYQMSSVNSVTIEVAIKAGPRCENESNAGMAHFLEHMLFEGTQKYPSAKKLSAFLENIGGISGAWTSKENVIYYVKVPKWHIKVAFEYLSEILFNSVFTDETVEKEKKIVQEEMNRRDDNPEIYIFDEWFEWTFGKNQAIGRPSVGYKETIESFTKESLRNYLASFYVPKNMVVGVAGNFDTKDVIGFCHKYFEVTKSGKRIVNFPKASFVPRDNAVKIIHRDIKQTHLILGFMTGIHYSHPDRFPMRIVADILYLGVSSRLWHRLIYEAGLTYSAGGQNWLFTDTGFFYTYGGYSPNRLAEAITIILEELQRLQNKKVSDKELQNVREKDKASILFGLETPDAVAGYLCTQKLLENRVLTPAQIVREIDKVSAEDIQVVARKYFTRKNLALTIVGPIDEVESLKISKALEILRSTSASSNELRAKGSSAGASTKET